MLLGYSCGSFSAAFAVKPFALRAVSLVALGVVLVRASLVACVCVLAALLFALRAAFVHDLLLLADVGFCRRGACQACEEIGSRVRIGWGHLGGAPATPASRDVWSSAQFGWPACKVARQL